MEFKLRGEYIELVKLLKAVGMSATGGEAKMMIEDGLVRVNDEVESRKRRKIRVGDKVQVGENTLTIS